MIERDEHRKLPRCRRSRKAAAEEAAHPLFHGAGKRCRLPPQFLRGVLKHGVVQQRERLERRVRDFSTGDTYLATRCVKRGKRRIRSGSLAERVQAASEP